MKILYTLLILFSMSSFSAEVRHLGRSAKGLLMGDAYTAIATDEYTLFYNPAILARHKGFSFAAINPTISAINVLKDSDRYSDVGSDPTDVYSAFAGTPVYLGLDAAPGFKMGHFGLTAIVNNKTTFSLKNEITPTLDLDHRYDKGFIAGYGVPLQNGLSVGVSTKYIQRESIDSSYYLFGTTLLDALAAGDINEVVSALGQVKGSGWGFDVGFDYISESPGQTFTAGLAILDFYTILHTDKNDDDLEVHTQPAQVNLGAAWKGEMGGGFDLTLSGDIRNLESQMELMRRVHLGLEVGISPAISILAGVNALDNYSYGLKANLGFLNIFTGFYGVDIGEKLGQEKSNRFLIYLSLFNFTFDP